MKWDDIDPIYPICIGGTVVGIVGLVLGFAGAGIGGAILGAIIGGIVGLFVGAIVGTLIDIVAQHGGLIVLIIAVILGIAFVLFLIVSTWGVGKH